MNIAAPGPKSSRIRVPSCLLNFTAFMAAFSLSLSLSLGCSRSNFSDRPPPVKENSASATVLDSSPETETKTETKTEIKTDTDTKTDTKTCESLIAYDPMQVDCSIGVDDSSSIWANTGGWSETVKLFKDRTAQWISPLAAVQAGSISRCPSVPENEMLIFVSSFTATAGIHNIELIVDNFGKLFLWKASDPKQEVVALENDGNYAETSVALEDSPYALVITSLDQGTASAAVASIVRNDHSLVKHTAIDKSWCAFRVAADTDPRIFVPSVASCLPCFGR